MRQFVPDCSEYLTNSLRTVSSGKPAFFMKKLQQIGHARHPEISLSAPRSAVTLKRVARGQLPLFVGQASSLPGGWQARCLPHGERRASSFFHAQAILRCGSFVLQVTV